MLVTRTKTNSEPDAAPLWLPRHDELVVDHASIGPADQVEGYSWGSRIIAGLFANRWKAAASAAMALTFVVFIASAPIMFDAGVGTVAKLAFYQGWTVTILMLATHRVRSIAITTVVKYWFVGMFCVAFAVYFASGPLGDLSGAGDRRSVWIVPILEELMKALPLLAAVWFGGRRWRHPGLCDLMVLGFVVGSGYAFYEDVLLGRAAVSGFEANAGFLVPSIYQPDGIFVVGHGVWTALIGLAIGLVALHRHQVVAAVGAALTALIVVGDHMAIHDANGTLDWVRQAVLNGKLVALVMIVATVAAIVLDQRRIDALGARDHLFPTDHGQPQVDAVGDADAELLRSLSAGRFRRLRNGVYTTIDSYAQHWPPLSGADTAPLAELARLGRAAEVPVGPGSSPIGWAIDPDAPAGHRFVGATGLSPYVVLDGEPALNQPRERPEAVALPVRPTSPDFWRLAGALVAGVAVVTVVRVLTAGEPSIEIMAAGLSETPTAAPLIRTAVGALAAPLAAWGFGVTVLGAGPGYGPGDNPTPRRANECEA